MPKPKNKLTIDEVKHIAKLANLKMSDDDLTKFQEQLSEIIQFVDQLTEMNTKDVIPTSQVTGQENIFREDNITPSFSQEEALVNAPKKHKGYFMVKAIFED